MPTSQPRARDLGIPFDGQPGALNAITDVPGVRVGHCTLDDPAKHGRARTGVTAIFPRAGFDGTGVAAAVFSFNGTGEMTGALAIEELGGFYGPIVLTGTLSVGTARDALLRWVARQGLPDELAFAHALPVIAETWDGDLSDAWSMPLRQAHVDSALECAAAGPVEEGAVGGGTGTVCHQFKGGIGSASRRFSFAGEWYHIGCLVQANHGARETLLIAGSPLGRLVRDLLPEMGGAAATTTDGSIVVVLATDAPLLPHQLRRLARRATVGLARSGGIGNSLSGDIFLAFSTHHVLRPGAGALLPWRALPDDRLDEIFLAAALATEEAIINALVGARTMVGASGLVVHALPHERLRHRFGSA